VVAVALGVAGCLKREGSFHIPPRHHTKDYTKSTAGQVVDLAGTRHLGGGRFRTASGEDYYDPRYS